MAVSFLIVPHESAQYREAVALRRKILRYPLGRDYSDEELAAEAPHMHVVGVENGRVVASLTLTRYDDHTARYRAVAVDSSLQGRGIGLALSRFVDRLAQESAYTRVYLHARETAVPFYEKQGYRIIGEKFDEVGIPHLPMEKLL